MGNKDKEALDVLIRSLQYKQTTELALLKEQIQVITESVRPLNILKNTLEEIVSIKLAKSNLIDGILVIGIDYVLKKVIPKNTDNKLMKTLVSFLEFALLKYVKRSNW